VNPTRIVRSSLFAFLLLASVCTGHAHARFGPVGNVGLTNPNALDPASDAFGSATATGDFNGDGIDDLAVADRQHPHLVRIYFGSTWAIGTAPVSPFQMVTVPVPMVPGASQGPAVVLAAGDFTRDITDDDELVVGVPGDSLSQNNAGAVFVLDRRPEGNWVVSNTLRQGFDNYVGISESGDHFGAALAVGDFDANGRADLAIGIPGETTGGAANSGAVYIVYQGVAGLMNSDEEVFYRGFNGLTGTPTANEQLGFALAAGDFNGDGADDLAVGIPGQTCAGQGNAGTVMVLNGHDGPGGLTATNVSYWSQATTGVDDDCEAGDRFGAALVAGRFDPAPIGQPHTADLAIGIPGEAIDGVSLAGAVAVLYGSSSGITASGNRFIHEALLPGGTTAVSGFGLRLASARLSIAALIQDSLVIGSPLASPDGVALAGRAWVIPSAGNQLAPNRARMLALTPAFALGPMAAQDAFGAQLALGDFNNDDLVDVAVGVPGNDTIADGAGGVQVIYASDFIFVDDFGH
jgi:hypothetical protein